MKKIIYTITVLAAVAIMANTAFGATILSTGFEEPTFAQDGSTINGVDGSASSEGVWWADNSSNEAAGAPYAATTDGYGATGGGSDGGLYIKGHAAGKMTTRVDLGQDLGAGDVVTVTWQARRIYRGFKMGAYETAVTDWDDNSVQAGLWIDHSNFVNYYIAGGNMTNGDTIPANIGWYDYTLTMNLSLGTYDMTIDAPAPYAVSYTGASMQFNPATDVMRYLVFQSYQGQASETLFDNLSVSVTPATEELILGTAFEEPTFEQDETQSGSAINGVNGSATGEGVWWARNSSIIADGAPFAITADGYGATAGGTDGGFFLKGHAATYMIARVDLGQDLDSGDMVEISFKARRIFRGFKFGTYETAVTEWSDTMVQAGLWIDHGNHVYPLDGGFWPYEGDTIPANIGWYDYSMTLNLALGTYDLTIDAPAPYAISYTGANMQFNPLTSDTVRYLVFESYQGQASETLIDNLRVVVTPTTEVLLLKQDFEPPPWDDGANSTIEADSPIDDSAEGGGVWNGERGYSSTALTWGVAGSGGMHNGGNLGLVIADIGQTISTGIVTVSLDLATDYRMGAFGGRADYSTVSIDGSRFGGDSSGILFGYAGHWGGSSGMSVYNLDPASPSAFYGTEYLDIAKTRTSAADATFGKVIFTINFNSGTYDVFWDAVFNDGVNPVTWSGLPLTSGVSGFRYLVWESVGSSETYYDNITVTKAIIGAPTVSVVNGAIDLQIGNLVEDQRYQVYWSNDPGSWTEAETIRVGDTETNWTDAGDKTGSLPGSVGKRFYKVGHK